MDRKIKKIIKEALSGERAKSHVQRISEFHRIQASPMFHEAAQYVKDTLMQMGLSEVEVLQFPSDGSIKYGTYVSPMGWKVESAELRLVEPHERLLVQFSTTPTSLHVHSKSTPKEGVLAELVEVGAGTKSKDYEGKNVLGKFVLATGRARWVHKQAVYERGAAGVITDTLADEFKGLRDSVDIPDAHSYQAIWPSKDDLEKVTFGFSVSKRQGNHLRSLLRGNRKVRLQAKVNARLFSSNLDIVTATIPGSSQKEEVFLISHLCHPRASANDNASGSGLLLEIARTIQSLINSKHVTKPKRTIRFLWVPETIGTIALLSSDSGLADKFIAGLNLDMVGEDQELCKSVLVLDKTPDSLPSYLNDFIFELIGQSVEEFDPATNFGSLSVFRFGESAHTGGSDHAEFVDSRIKIPCVMLLQWPDLFYHSSMDTIDKVSPSSLERVGWVATVAIHTLANASVNEAILFANLTLERGLSRIRRMGIEAIQDMLYSKSSLEPQILSGELFKLLLEVFSTFESKLKHVVWREQEAIKSVRKLATAPRLDSLIAHLLEEIKVCEEQEYTKVREALSSILEEENLEIPERPKETEDLKKAKSLVPQRLFSGTLSIACVRRGFSEEEYSWFEEMVETDPYFRSKLNEMANFMDGRRTLLDITQAISTEYSDFKVRDALRLLESLGKMKLVSVYIHNIK